MDDRWIGSRVAQERNRVGMTQEQLAGYMRGCGFKWSQATVWAVEKGDRPLRLEEASLLTGVFGGTADDLAGPTPQSAPDRAQRLVASVLAAVKDYAG